MVISAAWRTLWMTNTVARVTSISAGTAQEERGLSLGAPNLRNYHLEQEIKLRN